MRRIPIQIAVMMAIVLLVVIGINYFQDMRRLRQIVLESDKAMVENAAAAVKTRVKDSVESLLIISKALSANQDINQAMAEFSAHGNSRALGEALRKLYPELKLGVLMAVDTHKTIIYRANQPDSSGDKVDFPGLTEALSGKALALSDTAGSQGLRSHVVAPITLPNRKIAGALVVGVAFDDAYARKLAADAGAAVSFASEKGIWASSLKEDAKGNWLDHAEPAGKRFSGKLDVFVAGAGGATARLYTLLRLNEENTAVIVQMDTGASATLLREKANALLWTSMVLLLICAGIGVVAAYWLTRPRQLQQELKRLTDMSAEDAGARGAQQGATANMNALQVAAKLLAQHADESRAAKEKAEFSAQYDALTKLPNRSLMRDRLNLALAAAARNHSLVAFMFIDLDKFKPINDTLGHEVGDQVLQEAASRLRDCVREQDTVARLGGDEFVVILPNMKNTEEAAVVARNILASVNQRSAFTGSSLLGVSASVGIGVYPVDAANAEELIKCADAAMYHTKEGGRNGYQFFAPEMNARVNETLALESGLRLALERNEFELHFQPQVSLADGKLTGVEVLLRWRHPERGLLAPGVFLHVAEERGLVLPIGEWVLRTACRQNRVWQDEGLMPLPISINISPLQFRKKELPQIVSKALLDSGLAPRYLDLEIAESVLRDSAATNASVAALESSGLKLSIDNFGTGYSSVTYLKRLPISRVKIDRSLVGNVMANADNAAIVRTIITMARGLSLDVIAEGVETAEQIEFLLAAGCNIGQGHYFGKPVPADEFRALIGQSLPIRSIH